MMELLFLFFNPKFCSYVATLLWSLIETCCLNELCNVAIVHYHKLLNTGAIVER